MARKALPAEIKLRRPPLDDAPIIVADIEARLKAQSRRTIAEIIDKHPDEALAILRSWLRRGG